MVRAANLLVQQFETGGDRNFGYLAASGSRAALIDPSPDPDAILNFSRRHGLTIDYLFVTHGHPDHTEGCIRAGELTGSRPLGYGSFDGVTETKVSHGALFPVGGLELKILHTPGHTVDSMSLLIGDALFTGDTLFVGKVGGTDLGGGARAQFDSLHGVLLALPDTTRVFPGHDYGTSPQSTIGQERRGNPFLIQPDLASFIHLKRTWADYKKRHGIP